MQLMVEGSVHCEVPSAKKVSSRMKVFYNPSMAENRDITILFLNSFFTRPFSAASLMAATGVREVRMLKEVPMLKFVAINDGNPNAADLIKKNLDKNSIATERYSISTKEANSFLLSQNSWDYIDIDPFGTPNQFLDAAIRKSRNNGVIGITATDTAALSGTYPKATQRKYWATPLHTHQMHEIGIRIFLRKIQLVAAQYDKAAVPVFSYSSQHYYRVFVKLLSKKSLADSVLKQHGIILFCPSCCIISITQQCSCPTLSSAGPMWLGALWDKSIAAAIAAKNPWQQRKKLLETISQEAEIDSVGFFDAHQYAKKKQLCSVPSTDFVLQRIALAGFQAARTHFSPYGVRTNAGHDVIENILIQQPCGYQ